MRTFIAFKIKPQEKLVQLINFFRGSLPGEVLKWVDINNLHLTLKFMGDTSESNINRISGILEEIAARYPLIYLKFKGVGYFKTNSQPSVLFLKIDENDVLINLARDIDAELEKIGIERESRRFKPHLTIARIKYLSDKSTFYDLINRFKDDNIQTEEISQIIFYQSFLKPSGAVYRELTRKKLNFSGM